MCHWLRARLFVTDFRPVPLQEYAVFGGQVHAKVSPAIGNNFLVFLLYLQVACLRGHANFIMG